jgi:hypothetical protein
LITPVKPTTSIHITNTMPERLWMSSQQTTRSRSRPIGAELQFPHRWRIDDDAGMIATQNRMPISRKQFPRQTCIHVGMPLEHDVGEAAGDIRRIEILRGVRGHADNPVIDRTGFQRLADADHHRIGIIQVPDPEMRHHSGIFGQAVLYDQIETGERPSATGAACTSSCSR